MYRIWILLILIPLACSVPVTLLEETTATYDVYPAYDTTLYENIVADQELSNPGGPLICGVSGESSNTTEKRILFYFNWDALRALVDQQYQIYVQRSEGASTDSYTTIVQDAQLTLYMNRTNDPSKETVIDIHPLTQTWGRPSAQFAKWNNAGQGQPASIGDPTWHYSIYNKTKWTPGGDFVAVVAASQTVDKYGFYSWKSAAFLGELHAVMDDESRNFGWILVPSSNNTAYSTKLFDSTNSIFADRKPKITVTYLTYRIAVWVWIVAVVLGLVLITAVVVAVLLYKRRRRWRTLYHELQDSDAIAVKEVLDIPGLKYLRGIEVQEKIGRGAYAEVFKAVWKEQNKPVAVKKLVFAGSLNDSFQLLDKNMQDFIQEIKILNALDHPNILSLLGVAMSPEKEILLVMEMMYGSLADILYVKKIVLSDSRILSIATDIAYGMHYLHSVTPAVLHRDLKPQNILVTDKWTAKVADFGISAMLQRTVRTMTRSGTPIYMAPESISQGKFSEKSDVYSFGIVLGELVSRQAPYEEVEHEVQIIFQVVYENRRPLVPDTVSPKYQQLIKDCVAPKPEDRPSFKQVIDQLKDMEVEVISESPQ